MPADRLRYGFARTSVAALLVAFSEKGVVAVVVRERHDYAALEGELARRFPAATLVHAADAVGAAVTTITRFVEQPTGDIALPLDIRATGFAARVYQAVLAIPFGETRTFAEVARAIDASGAARAVGAACARNPIEFAIPCHRVLRGDGRWAGGGTWGDWRQSVIVGRERAAVAERLRGEHA